jgi:MSHA biogenesis protein MshL
MSVDVRDGRTGIPGVADSNVLLRNSDRQARKREIVILLKTTIIQNDASWGQDLRETRERLERFIPRRPAQEASPR